VACPFGRLVITIYPLLPTPILLVPFGKAHDNVLLGICALCKSIERLAWGASILAANSLY
jgi:hypothetical protein